MRNRRLIGKVARRLPALARGAGSTLARIEMARGTPRVARLRENFRSFFPDAGDETIDAFVSEFLSAGVRSAIEVARYDAMSAAALRRLCRDGVTTRGLAHLDAAADAAAPVVLFTPHYGDYALGAVWLALAVEGRKRVMYFYDPPERNPFATTLRRLLDKVGVESEAIHNDRSAVLKALKGLKRGSLLTMMPDIYQYDLASQYAPFFHGFTVVMPGTAFFALKSGATLLPLYCHSDERGRPIFELDAPIVPHRSGDDAADTYDLSVAIVRSMETHIRRQPALWSYWESAGERLTPAAHLPRAGEPWERSWRELRDAVGRARPDLSDFFDAFEARRAGAQFPLAPSLQRPG